MPRWLSLLILWVSPVLITSGTITFALFVNAIRVGFGRTRPGWPIAAAAVAVWCLHIGYLIGPWLWTRGRLVLGLWLTSPVAVLAMGFWLFFAGRLAFSAPSSNPDLTHKWLWILGLTAGLLAYLGPVAVMVQARESWIHRLIAAPAFPATLGVVANVVSVLVSFSMLVMLMAGSANSTPEKLQFMKQLMMLVGGVGLVGVCGGVWAWFAGRTWLSVGLGGAPCLLVAVLITLAVRLKW